MNRQTNMDERDRSIERQTRENANRHKGRGKGKPRSAYEGNVPRECDEAPAIPDHNAEKWVRDFKRATQVRPPNTRLPRQQIQWDTLRALSASGYVDNAGAAVDLPTGRMLRSAANSVQYAQHGQDVPLATAIVPVQTEFRVINQDCLEAAKALLDLGASRVAVLNMANQTNPGGGWLGGAGAQEENLHRRSNLSDHLSNYRNEVMGHKVSYPIGEFGCVFSPDVCVFRGAEASGYPFMPEPFFVNVLSAAAYVRPKCQQDRMILKFQQGTTTKITHLLRMARLNGMDNLVLSALGCGAFWNPPRHMAEIFRDVLRSDEFVGQFQRVWFAIIEDHNSGAAGNVAPFRAVFEVAARRYLEPAAAPVQPQAQSALSKAEKEALRLAKVLRDIFKLQKLVAEGGKLEVLQQKKLESLPSFQREFEEVVRLLSEESDVHTKVADVVDRLSGVGDRGADDQARAKVARGPGPSS